MRSGGFFPLKVDVFCSEGRLEREKSESSKGARGSEFYFHFSSSIRTSSASCEFASS